VRAGGPAGEKAIMEIYAAYQQVIKTWIDRWMQRYGYYRDEAGDLAHDAFLIMIHKVKHGTVIEGHITTFWFGIAKYVWLNHYKRDHRLILVDDPEEFYQVENETPETILMDREKFKSAEIIFDQCGGKCREVLLLWLQQYTMDEIAEKLNLSSSNLARKIKYECLKKLKYFLKKGNNLDL
ncbi:MAG: sigma-70 family RNA polymerase sigma factor, partial [Bacteroidota bacterium]|nr:sigma-70 family RNA polymerase sigma factor [Bacteroidota bacterium]